METEILPAEFKLQAAAKTQDHASPVRQRR